MPVEAAGVYRRTRAERLDQQISWRRSDQAFFAAGACHILAWTCRDTYSTQPVDIAAIRFSGENQVFHTFATWRAWAFDHSGWHLERALLRANEAFERRPIERLEITAELRDFCAEHRHRMPDQYWDDPLPRAREYVQTFAPPWAEIRTDGRGR